MQSSKHRVAGLSVCLAVLVLGGCSFVYDGVGGAFHGSPQEMMTRLSPGASALLDQVLDGIEPGSFVDHHVHILTADVNDQWQSWLHPIKRSRLMVYLSAAGAEPAGNWPREYVERLVQLIRHNPAGGRYHLLAMDKYHHPDGRADDTLTPFYVSNENVYALAEQFLQDFVPVISVHPYRHDAIEQLEYWAERGVRYVKWLPNTMGIDPSNPLCDAFYQSMLDYQMVLCTHTGDENALEAPHPDYGNPLLLRRPLDMGVRVITFHAASKGRSIDLDDPRQPTVESFDLFLRLMETPRHEGLLFGETSAMTFVGHVGRPVRTLLERSDLQHRFVHGSDYPLVAVNWAVNTLDLVANGMITETERRHLEEIYGYNPLLFDLAVKRTIRHPETGRRLPASLFTVPPGLP